MLVKANWQKTSWTHRVAELFFFNFFFMLALDLFLCKNQFRPTTVWLKNSDETRSNIGFKKSLFFQNQINMHTFYFFLSRAIALWLATWQLFTCQFLSELKIQHFKCQYALHVFEYCISNSINSTNINSSFWLISWILC